MGHADSFWAWALANYAIPKQRAVKGFYEQYREKRVGAEKVQSEVPAAEPRKGKSLGRVLREMGMK
jgi:hypothetical protein